MSAGLQIRGEASSRADRSRRYSPDGRRPWVDTSPPGHRRHTSCPVAPETCDGGGRVETASGAALAERAPASAPPAGLHATDVSLTFRGARTTQALDAVTLHVAPREVVALIGPNGCGKSTLLRVLSGLLAPDTGEVSIDGRPVHGPDERVGLVFQEPRLLAWRSAAGNVAFPLELAGWPRSRQRSTRGRPARSRRRARGRERQAVDPVGRHAPAGRDRAGARARAPGPAARRAVQRPRRPDPRAVQRGAARPLAAHRDHDRPRHAQHPRGGVPRRPRPRAVAPPGPHRRGHPRRPAAAAPDRRYRLRAGRRDRRASSAGISSRTSSRERRRAHPPVDRGDDRRDRGTTPTPQRTAPGPQRRPGAAAGVDIALPVVASLVVFVARLAADRVPDGLPLVHPPRAVDGRPAVRRRPGRTG